MPSRISQRFLSSNLQRKFPEIYSHIKKELRLHPEKKELIQKACEELSHTKLYKIDSHKKISFSPVSSLINKATVLRGAWKFWDPIRLLTGKHESMSKIGAEHVMVQNRTGDKIDATYIDIKSFSESLGKYGGQKCLFKPNIKNNDLNPWNGSFVNIDLSHNQSIKALKIDFKVLLQGADLNQIEDYYQQLGYVVHLDMGSIDDPNSGGDLLVIAKQDDTALRQSPYMKTGELREPIVLKTTNNSETIFSDLSKLTASFTGYYFDTYSEDLNEVLNKLDINKSPWRYQKIGNHGYLLKVQDIKKVEHMESGNKGIAKIERYEVTPVDVKSTGTVLLAMNQLEVYEQYCSELLTFLLEDINVMAYNNGGKGLSVGNATIENIQEAAESAYQFLHQVKKIPDKKILAKGQCFGGAPTAWLGAKHPNINLMIDQAPANFHEVASTQIKRELKKKMNAFEDHKSLKYKFYKLLYNSQVIDVLTKAVMLGFDVARDIHKNRGHNLLHINLPTSSGAGGDQVVPKHHPERMIDSFGMRSDRIYALSVNEGGIHVSNWFVNPSCYSFIMEFLHKTNMAPNISKNEESLEKALELRLFHEKEINSELKLIQAKLHKLQRKRKKNINYYKQENEEIQSLIRQMIEFKAKTTMILGDYSRNAIASGNDAFEKMISSVLVGPIKNKLTETNDIIKILNDLLIPIAPSSPVIHLTR